MYASNGGSLSQGTSNATRPLNEPWWFTRTLGVFGSKILNAA